MHFRAALRAAEDLSLRLERADVQRLCAGMLIDRKESGETARIRELLEGAAGEYSVIRHGRLRDAHQVMTDGHGLTKTGPEEGPEGQPNRWTDGEWTLGALRRTVKP
ncbi:MAG: hypothetical protein ACR2L4_10440 [Actinomycetota bacterium]